MAIAIDRGLCELRATKLISLFSFCRNRRKSDFAGQFIPLTSHLLALAQTRNNRRRLTLISIRGLFA